MIGELNSEQIERVLLSGAHGRLGCYAEGRVYVVPITYAYDGERIIGHTGEGMKVRMMRANPEICFQTDQIETLSTWRSVIAWGTYQELQGSEAITALAFLVDKVAPHFGDATGHPFEEGQAVRPREERDHQAQAIVFAIRLKEKTGRFERRQRPHQGPETPMDR